MKFLELQKEVNKKLNQRDYNFEEIITNEEDACILVEILKSKDFLIDHISGRKYNKVYKNLSYTNMYLREYLNEIELVNKLFRRKKRILGKSLKNIKNKYLLATLIKAYSSLIDKIRFSPHFDDYNTNFCRALKQLTYDPDIYSEHGFKYLSKPFPVYKNLIFAENYFYCYLKLQNIDHCYNMWKANCGNFKRKNLHIQFVRLKNNQYYTYGRNYCKELDKRLSNCRQIVSGIAKDWERTEQISRKFIKETFFVKDFSNPIYQNLSLNEIIKGLIDIQKESFFQKENFVCFDLNEWCNKLNLSKEKTKTFLNLFSLGRHSSDAIDYPIIKLNNGKFGFITALVRVIVIPNILESFLVNNSNNLNLKHYSKGENFERHISDILSKYNILHILNFKIKSKIEIDSLFIIDNTLYVCECKCRKYGIYDNFKLLEMEFCENLSNKINFVKSNLKSILNEFRKQRNDTKILSQINSIKGLLINAYSFCESKIINNIIISDVENFDALVSMKKRNLRKSLTSDKFNKILLGNTYYFDLNRIKISKFNNKVHLFDFIQRFKLDYIYCKRNSTY